MALPSISKDIIFPRHPVGDFPLLISINLSTTPIISFVMPGSAFGQSDSLAPRYA